MTALPPKSAAELRGRLCLPRRYRGEYESMWSLFRKLPFFNKAPFGSFGKLVGAIANREWWITTRFDLPRIAQVMGVPIDEAQKGFLEYLVGENRGILREVAERRPRSCPRCDQKGFHTVLFQLKFVTSCPIHCLPLREEVETPYECLTKTTLREGRPPEIDRGGGEKARLESAVVAMRNAFVERGFPARTIRIGDVGLDRFPRQWIPHLATGMEDWLSFASASEMIALDAELSPQVQSEGAMPLDERLEAVAIYKAICRRIWRRELSRKDRLIAMSACNRWQNILRSYRRQWATTGLTQEAVAYVSWRVAWERAGDAIRLFCREIRPGQRLRPNHAHKTNPPPGVRDLMGDCLRSFRTLDGQEVTASRTDRLRIFGRVCLHSYRTAAASRRTMTDPYFGSVFLQPCITARMMVFVSCRLSLP